MNHSVLAAICLISLVTLTACKRAPTTTDAPPGQRTIATIEGLSLLEPGDTVLDSKTNLVWRRCSLGETWNGSGCDGSPREVTFAEATQASPKGWRVPSIRELSTLVSCESNKYVGEMDVGDGLPALKEACDGINGAPALHSAFLTKNYDLVNGLGYWSATTNRQNDSYTYIIYFKQGQINGLPKAGSDSRIYVRFVRNADSAKAN